MSAESAAKSESKKPNVKVGKADQHIVPRSGGGWVVRKSGADRATRVFERKSEAERFARDLAKKANGELYIHRRDGSIRERDSYGKNPNPPKG